MVVPLGFDVRQVESVDRRGGLKIQRVGWYSKANWTFVDQRQFGSYFLIRSYAFSEDVRGSASQDTSVICYRHWATYVSFSFLGGYYNCYSRRWVFSLIEHSCWTIVAPYFRFGQTSTYELFPRHVQWHVVSFLFCEFEDLQGLFQGLCPCITKERSNDGSLSFRSSFIVE